MRFGVQAAQRQFRLKPELRTRAPEVIGARLEFSLQAALRRSRLKPELRAEPQKKEPGLRPAQEAKAR